MFAEKIFPYEDELFDVLSKIGAGLRKENNAGITISFNSLSVGIHDKDVIEDNKDSVEGFFNSHDGCKFVINHDFERLEYFVHCINEKAKQEGKPEPSFDKPWSVVFNSSQPVKVSETTNPDDGTTKTENLVDDALMSYVTIFFEN